jgi:uncharacterized membrane protein
MRARKGKRSLFSAHVLFFVVTLLLLLVSTSALGAGGNAAPERQISVAPEYTGVIIASGEDISVDVIVVNGGRRDENVKLEVTSVPQGWKAWVKTYSFGITGVHVASDKTKNLTLRVEPDDNAAVGEYRIGLKAQTEDGVLSSSGQLRVTVEQKKEAEKKAGGVNILTSYPVLRGPTDGKFEFSLEVENKLDKDSIFNVTAQGPDKWDVNFKPAYEDKLISSLRLKAGQSQTVAVEVKPFRYADPGQYPITVKVSSPEAKGEALLNVVLTGTYKLDAGTATGLLSLEAMRGKGATVSFYVKNTGSAALTNVQFLSFKPENWTVTFSPEKIESLEPDALKQVEVAITPAEQSLVGDYSVGISAESGKASKTLEFRVTVKASTAWGWIGIGIIVLVMAGLVTLFIRLGRR